MSTPMTPKEYVALQGVRCPFCTSTGITGQSVEIDGGTCTQEVTCNNCDRAWIDTYVLTGYTPLTD